MDSRASLPSQPQTYLIIFSEGAGRWRWRSSERTIKTFFQSRRIPHVFLPFHRRTQSLQELEIERHVREHGITRILVAGGDGTVRAVAEYLVHRGVDIPMGPIPVGSANVLARALRIPSTLTRALAHLIRATPRRRPIGLLNGRHVFLISACFGRFADVTVRADAYQKHILGFGAYILTGFRYLLRFPRMRMDVRPTDAPRQIMNAHSMLIFPGGMGRDLVPVIPESSPRLQVLSFHNSTVFGLLQTFGEMYALKRLSPYASHLQTESLELRTDAGSALHLDGDSIEHPETSCRVEMREEAVSLLY